MRFAADVAVLTLSGMVWAYAYELAVCLTVG